MKKGFYLIQISQKDVSSYGVMKKVIAQVKVFQSIFDVKLDLINTYKVQAPSLWEKIKMRLPYMPVSYNWQYKEEYKNADFIYMRRPNIDHSLVSLFKKIKKYNPKCKIIFEIPTYPYIPEIILNGLMKELPFIIKDYVNHNLFKSYVDRVVTFSKDTEIWGIPTISVKNGVDFSSIQVPVRKTKENTIEVIEVSFVNFWHGYDRFLVGMGEYYKNGGTRNIIFHIVGDGMSIPLFKQIIKEYSLEEHVIIHGNKSGEELNALYRRSFIGLDGLARHRSNNLTNSSLKSREYAAYGLPFISSVDIDFADDTWPYVMHVAHDETPINMEDVIEFYDNIYKNKDCNEVAREIREYSELYCDMNIVMQPIIDYINE